MSVRIFFSEMTREEVREIAPTTTVILCTSSIEQHGPHLPIRTDTELCETVCRRAAEIASAEVAVTIAPTLHFGSSHHHITYPGVLSLSSATFHRVLYEICESLVRSGFRRIMIVNGHGGNDAIARQVALDIAVQYDVVVAAGSYWTIAETALARDGQMPENWLLPGHAGGFETSCMMAARPDLVSPTTKPPLRDHALVLSPPRPGGLTVHRHQAIQRVDGYTDDARDASPAHGEQLMAIMARELARAIVQFSRS